MRTSVMGFGPQGLGLATVQGELLGLLCISVVQKQHVCCANRSARTSPFYNGPMKLLGNIYAVFSFSGENGSVSQQPPPLQVGSAAKQQAVNAMLHALLPLPGVWKVPGLTGRKWWEETSMGSRT